MNFEFSIIIPVYNRPQEIQELLASCVDVTGINCCEIVIVEDGSEQTCQSIVETYKRDLNLSYYFKTNSGPGDSRNYGMRKAKTDYFIILDSDVLLPKNYIINIKNHLNLHFVHCFGGPDKAHQSFSEVQKAINYSMTSFWTTGGVRGREKQKKGFQPRSFNMGLSKKAFQDSGGFSSIHPGEDPDLSLRLKELGYQTDLFSDCYVYHKRRINWQKFANQVYKFGLVRPILNLWHPNSHKMIFYLPSVFSLGFLFAIGLILLDVYVLFLVYGFYFIFVLIDAFVQTKSLKIACYAVWAICIQFFGYGFAFLKSSLALYIFKHKPEKKYPFLFYKSTT